jgi:D-xylose 1-dehydrogenase (NADP+, D-xylono-1,5-lactone-forming)
MNRKIWWGILGTARMAGTFLNAARASRTNDVVAIASRDISKAEAFATAHQIPRAYGGYEELLADPAVDAVYVPLPVSLHAAWALRCAAAGKPMICEKPLAANATEARAIAAAFAARHLPVAEGLMYRFHPLNAGAVEIVKNGGVGQPLLVRASFSAPLRDLADIKLRPDTGGGALRDLGVYCVSVLRWLTGTEPVRVSAFAKVGADSGVDETVVAALEFPGGVLGQLACSFRSGFECSYGVVGTTGSLLVDRGALCAWPDGAFSIKHWHDGQATETPVPPANHYQLLIEDFADALLNKRAPRFPISDSVANLEVMDRIMVAAGINGGLGTARPTNGTR